MFVVWDIMSHMVSISVGRCLAWCIGVDWTELQIQQETHLQIHADLRPSCRSALRAGLVRTNSVQGCVFIFQCLLVQYLCASHPLGLIFSFNFSNNFSQLKCLCVYHVCTDALSPAGSYCCFLYTASVSYCKSYKIWMRIAFFCDISDSSQLNCCIPMHLHFGSTVTYFSVFVCSIIAVEELRNAVSQFYCKVWAVNFSVFCTNALFLVWCIFQDGWYSDVKLLEVLEILPSTKAKAEVVH